MTLEFNSTDYITLLNGLAARTEKVHRLIEIFGQDDESPNVVQHYRDELLDIETTAEKLTKAFNRSADLADPLGINEL